MVQNRYVRSILGMLCVLLVYGGLPNAVQASTCPASDLQHTRVSLDGVNLAICTSFVGAASFATSDPTLNMQVVATTYADANGMLHEFSITAIPFGTAAITENLPPADLDSEALYRLLLKNFRRQQGGAPQIGPSALLFGKLVPSSITIVRLFVKVDAATPVAIAEWIVEAGNRLWIVRASQELTEAQASARDTTTFQKSINDISLAGSDLSHPSSSVVAQRRAEQGRPAAPMAPAIAADLLPAPAWWNGDCDINNYRNWTGGKNSYPLGGSYRGVKACGPRPNWDAGAANPGPIVRFFSGAWGEYEWQCVELVMRYMYQAFNIKPYGANGSQVVPNYSGAQLLKINNGTVGKAPKPGDVMSFGATSTAGHTAIVIDAVVDGNGNGTVKTLNQNLGGSSAEVLQGYWHYTVQNWRVVGDATGWLHDPATDTPAIISSIDSPNTNATVVGNYPISGWAIHQAAASGTGIDAVHVYFDGPAGSGARGVAATYGVRRDDVAAAYGDRYRYAGYQLEDSSAVLSIGQHTLYVYAHSTFTDQWQLATRTFSVANTPPNVPTQATPTNGATVAGPTVQFSWQDPGDYDNRPRNYRDYMIEVKNGSGQVVAQMPWTATATWEANLADGTYSWHIQSGDGAVGSGWSADWSFTVSSTIVKPSNLAGEVTTGGIRLTWHDNATNELGYRVYRWRGEDLTWPLIGQAAGTEFTDTQVVCGVTYFYLVSAFNNSGESEREGWVAVSMPGCPAPGSPLHPGVSSDESFATITWDAASGIVTGYNIYRLIDLGGSWDYTRVGQATAEQRSYTDIGLACESGYFYQISAYNPYGESARVDVPMAETTACSLAAPTGLHVSLADKGALMLAWNDDNLWEHGFNIYRWNGQQSIWERIGQREANLTTFADIGLACDSTYYYEVKAYRNERESGSAGWITTQTQACSATKHSVFIPRAGK